MANVKFKRLLTSELASEAVEDGKVIWIKNGNNDLYLDVGTTRKRMIPSDTTLSTTSTNPIENQALTNSIINTRAEVLAITADYIPCGTKPVKEIITNLDRKLTSNATDDVTYAKINTIFSGNVVAGTTVDFGIFSDDILTGKTFVGAHLTPIASTPIIMSYYNGHVYAYSLGYSGAVTYTMTIYYKD